MYKFQIKTKSDALRLAKMFVAESPELNKWDCLDCDTAKPFIQLWDEMTSNRIIVFIREDDSSIFDRLFYVRYIDTVNGTEKTNKIHLEEIAEAIWRNRKFINHSGQIDAI